MTEKEILALIDRYNQGTASMEECGLLESWYIKHARDNTDIPYPEGLKERMDRSLTLILAKEQFNPKASKWTWTRIAAAAVVILSIGASIIIYNTKSTIKPQEQIVEAPSPILPGGNKAYLTLSDGTRISLSDAENGTISQQSGLIITKTKDGQLIYSLQHVDEDYTRIDYNSIETPNGGQYQVRLPDGTLVWLNAASTLSYPTRFEQGKERRVKLSGEGYFEVAPDSSSPFIVSSENQEVKVLGTHFNISAYKDNPNTITTLLEGRVNVSKPGALAKVINPGEQVLNSTHELTVSKVNASYAIDWKDGYFRFNGKNLEIGLQEIARWYNVKIIYKKESLKNEPLAGRISKYDRIEQVLKKMELAGLFHFTIQGREIIVE